MSKLTKSTVILFIVLILGNLLLDIPRILGGYYSEDSDVAVISETKEKAEEIASETNADWQEWLEDASTKEVATLMITNFDTLLWSKVKLGFTIRILLLTLIFLGVVNRVGESPKNRGFLIPIGLIALVGFLFTLAMEQTAEVSGMFYFTYTTAVLLFLLFKKELTERKWNWLIVPLVATLFYLLLNEGNIGVSRWGLFDTMIEARMGAIFYYIFGFISWSIYFVAPIYFIKINSDKAIPAKGKVM